MSLRDQPVSRIEWVDRGELSANSWNPNRQAPPEHRLLKVSIMETGWTQPIVVREHDAGERLEIVDGYHRWLVSADPAVAALADGSVPIVRLPECSPTLARMTTIRHNRARGTHYVLAMADIVHELLGMGLTRQEIRQRLEMDEEEIERLADRGNMTVRGAAAGFSTGWTV